MLHTISRRSLTLALWLHLLCASFAVGENWTYWRGPAMDGISHETGLIDDWNPEGGDGSHVRWQRDDLGGRSTPVVFQGKLYTLVRSHPGTNIEGEKVVCVDTATGATLWEHSFNVYLSDVPDTRVGWSSCVVDPETGNVYAQGVCGLFLCLDGKSGEVKWQVPLHEQFGLLSTYGGRTNFPIVFENLVITSGVIIGWGDMAKPCHRYLAFDKQSGQVVWFSGTRDLPDDTTYSAPCVTVINGQRALVFGAGDGGIWALQPRTGQPIWKYWFSRRGLNVPPLADGNRIYSSHSEENMTGTTMGAVVALDATGQGDITDTGEVWKVEEIMAGKTAPLLIDNRLFIFDDRAKLHVLDSESGERVGKLALGTMMRSSPLFADGKIYAFTADERWYILAPDEKRGVKKLRSGRLLKGDECNASPIAAEGNLFVQTSGRLYCLADPAKSPGSVPSPPPLKETPVGQDDQATHLQIVPAEALLKTGDALGFTARLFNARGQFLREVAAKYTLEGPGNVDEKGNYHSTPSAKPAAVLVTATAEGLSGHARLRVVPPLPWKFDFEDVAISPTTRTGEPPITWVGCRYRHVVRDINGDKVMVKVTTIPKGTRSRCWFGPSDLHDYTIQADVLGREVDGKMPDIGLIAQGYAIDLQGANQALQIRSWVPQLRMATTIDFPWRPDLWYTVKLRSETYDDHAVLRGKVWPRDDAEPDEWTVIAEDQSPNRSGSPGLYGNAKDAEILLDNLTVVPNP